MFLRNFGPICDFQPNHENLKIISNFIEQNRNYPKFVYYQVPGGHDPWNPSVNEKIFGDGKINDYELK